MSIIPRFENYSNTNSQITMWPLSHSRKKIPRWKPGCCGKSQPQHLLSASVHFTTVSNDTDNYAAVFRIDEIKDAIVATRQAWAIKHWPAPFSHPVPICPIPVAGRALSGLNMNPRHALGAEFVKHAGVGLHQAHQIFGLENTERAKVGAGFSEPLQFVPTAVGRDQEHRLRMP
jgi:hypothetical protein